MSPGGERISTGPSNVIGSPSGPSHSSVSSTPVSGSAASQSAARASGVPHKVTPTTKSKFRTRSFMSLLHVTVRGYFKPLRLLAPACPVSPIGRAISTTDGSDAPERSKDASTRCFKITCVKCAAKTFSLGFIILPTRSFPKRIRGWRAAHCPISAGVSGQQESRGRNGPRTIKFFSGGYFCKERTHSCGDAASQQRRMVGGSTLSPTAETVPGI